MSIPSQLRTFSKRRLVLRNAHHQRRHHKSCWLNLQKVSSPPHALNKGNTTTWEPNKVCSNVEWTPNGWWRESQTPKWKFIHDGYVSKASFVTTATWSSRCSDRPNAMRVKHVPNFLAGFCFSSSSFYYQLRKLPRQACKQILLAQNLNLKECKE